MHITAMIRVCEDGYEYRDDKQAGLTREMVARSGKWRYYNPLSSKPNLYVDFTQLELTEDNLIHFCESHGPLLGGDIELSSCLQEELKISLRVMELIRENSPLLDAMFRREQESVTIDYEAVGCRDPRVIEWEQRIEYQTRYVIHRMKEDLSLLRKELSEARGKDKAYLQSRIDHTELVLSNPNHHLQRDARPDRRWMSIRGRYAKSDRIGPARELIIRAINSRLNLNLFVAPFQGQPPTLQVEINHLNDVMWYQLARAFTEHREIRRCKDCGKAFEVSPSCYRGHKEFCNDACRIRHLRKRQRTAKTMRADGAHLRDIAKTVGSDLATVKKWVGESD